MRIAIATDAWSPQVNGVVNSLRNTRDQLRAMGHDVLMITPLGCRTIPCPTYPEIRLALFQGRKFARTLDEFRPHSIHIATEGTIGLTVRKYCVRRNLPFTTAYHTQFPEYVRARASIPIPWTVAMLRWFHGRGERMMVPTRTIQKILEQRGFENIVIWSRGVDTKVFVPDVRAEYELPRPVWVYMGRVAVEKNIEHFLDLQLEGSKLVIGNGPDLVQLRKSYPGCHFLGYKFGSDLAEHLAGADVFVFPSKTDTFGLVLLEAMACGLPVAAFPVTGPIDVVRDGETGILDEDLTKACQKALTLDRTACRAYAEQFSWAKSTQQFEMHLASHTRKLISP